MSLDPEKQEELKSLITGLQDGYLSEVDGQRLNDLLKSDPEARKYYFKIQDLHQRLYLNYNGGGTLPAMPKMPKMPKMPEMPEIPEMLKISVAPGKTELHLLENDQLNAPADSENTRSLNFSLSAFHWIGTIAAACVLGLTLFGIMKPKGSFGAPEFVAKTTHANHLARFAGFEVGDVLRRGEVKLTKGVLQLQMLGGAQVTLQGPAAVDLSSADRIVLHEGRLLADVPHEATGFTVVTSQGEIADVGPRFGVRIDRDGRVEAHLADAPPSQFPVSGIHLSDLLVNGDFEEAQLSEGPPKEAGLWGGDIAVIVRGEKLGISPFEGSSMLQFEHTISTKGNVYKTGPSRSSDLWQVVDIRPYKVTGAELRADLKAWFNRVHQGKRTDRRFQLSLYGFTGPLHEVHQKRKDEAMQARASVKFNADRKPGTWESLTTGFDVPEDVDFLLIGIAAHENRKDNPANEQEFLGHFADAVSLRITRSPAPAQE